jgi:hypothetical protein
MKPHVCMLAHVLLMCSELTICGHLNPFYADVCKVKATRGYTYLVHIVSSCINFGLYFAFVDHSLILVWTNSGYVQPFMVDVVIVQPSQSVDVLVTANHIFWKFYMATTPFSVAPYSIVSSQILHHDVFYPLQILLETMGLLCRPQGTGALGQRRGLPICPNKHWSIHLSQDRSNSPYDFSDTML